MNKRNTTASFPERCRYARIGILMAEDSRALDDCFEMGDGAAVVAWLMRAAETDERLKEAIRWMFRNFDTWEEIPWIATAASLAHIPDAELGAEAARQRRRTAAEFAGMMAYTRDVRENPTCGDGTPRPEWGALSEITREAWIRSDPARRYASELTPEGEQYVIPGCEKNRDPEKRQLDLF